MIGEGPPLLFIPGWVSHIDHAWEEPTYAHFVRAIVGAVRGLGLQVRAGLHTGECEIVDGKAAGIAVHIGARCASEAAGGEVLVSRTVKDLVAGSGIEFESRGEQELKGGPGRWELLRVLVD